MNTPTDAELEILQILWDRGPSTVRAVNEALNMKRKVGYTTTLKIMQIMSSKGLLQRDTQARSHIYSPILAAEAVQSSILDHVLKTAFRGDTSRLVMQALGNHRTTREEMEAIKALINKLGEE